MEKTTLSKIIDNLFLIFVVFITAFLWIRYNEHNPLLILLYSSIATIIVCSLFHVIFKYKNKKKTLNAKHVKQIELLTQKLTFATQSEVIKIFEQALKKRDITYAKTTKYLAFDNNLIVPVFNKIKIDENALLEIFLYLKTKKISAKLVCICACDFDVTAKSLASKFTDYNILLYDKNQTYTVFFKPVQYVVENVAIKKQKTPFKQKIKTLTNVAFNKKRFKSYMVCAIILLIASYFMRYNLYYLISSSILILFALFSYFNKPFNVKEKNLFGE